MRIALVDKRTSQILRIVDQEEMAHLGGFLVDQNLVARVEFANVAREDEDTLSATLLLVNGVETWAVYEDEEKIDNKLQASRDKKLTLLREKRELLLIEADNEIRKHEDSDFQAKSTLQLWRTYRIQLRQATNGKKHQDNPNHGTSALDAFASDLSDFTWPVKPG